MWAEVQITHLEHGLGHRYLPAEPDPMFLCPYLGILPIITSLV